MMFFLRKIKVILFCSLILVSNSAFSQNQDKEHSRFNVTMSPIGFILGFYNLGLDVAVTKNVSLGFGGAAFDYDQNDASVDGIGLNAKASYFFSEVFNDSWYSTFDVGMIDLDGENKDTGDTASLEATSMSLKLGYMWRWTNFNIQFGFGVTKLDIDISNSTSVDLQNDLEDLDGVNPALDFTLGYAF